MTKKTKILIAGIGGVGGYFGGLLAKHFYKNENIEVNFLARGGHLKEIKTRGLKVIHGKDEFIAKPNIATDNPIEIGVADLVLICTKTYDLETVTQQLRPCINKDTIILPLLNGVDSKGRIKNIFPDNLILDGCVYIVSRLKQDGIIENSGNIQKLFFGLDNFVNDRLLFFEKIFKEANIEAKLTENISKVIWEKFIFISPTATATTYFDKCIGEILSGKEELETITALIEEIKKIAKKNQIDISEDITEKTMTTLKGLPFQTTSSMHSDFKNKRPKNELQTLTGFIINQGQELNIETPVYLNTYTKLMGKSGL